MKLFYPYLINKRPNYFISLKKTCLLLLGIFLVTDSFSQGISVTTQRYDNKRLGWNSRETILTTANVSHQTFGLLFRRLVDDQIYAQPLLISNLFINGKHQNVVYVATVNNTVYAFNADDSAAMTPLWQVNFTPPGTRVLTATDMSLTYLDFSGNIGIVGTPVIDTTTLTMYFVSRDLIIATNVYEQYLHAIDITNGNEKPGSPVKIDATYPGRGQGSTNNILPFNSQRQNQRPALLLYNGVIYICWASHLDLAPYHGWMIGYDATTLQKKYTYNNTPDGGGGGIWMSGTGPTVDDNGYIYVSTGNGTTGFNGNPNFYRDRSESVLKLVPSGDSMRLVNFFTPANFATLDSLDGDYGVDGVLIIPNTNTSLSGSKEGKVYVVHTTNMGKYNPGNDSVRQILFANKQLFGDNHIHGTPAYYHYVSATDTECVYVWAESDSLKQFFYNRSADLFDLSKTISGDIKLDNGMPGGILSVSSNGQTAGTGILWANHPLTGDANHQVRPGAFDAYDARDIRRLLWSSTMNPGRDSVGKYAKFNTPVVANGKTYLGTFSNRLNVYGLFSQLVSALPAPWNNGDVGSVAVPGSTSYSNGTFTVNGSGADISGTADGFQFVYQMFPGNGNIVARVVSQTNTNASAKAGVIIRESFSAGAPYAATLISPGSGVTFQNRLTANAGTNTTQGASVITPYWLKIERKGNMFISSSSANGTTWTKIDSATINMAGDVYIGFGVTSHNNSVLSTAAFDNVVVTPPFSNPNPIAVINASQTNGIAPLAVSFTSAGSIDLDGEPITFSWNFGDGTTGTGATVSHTYTVIGTYLAVLTVSDAHGSSTASVDIIVNTGALPLPWNNNDVGSVGVAGSATYLGGVYTVKGSGLDIWGVADAFQFVYQPLSGDGNIVARVATQINNNGWAKAGVMIRESLNPGSVNASTLVTPVNGIQFQNRTTSNGYSGHTAGALAAAPYWVKVERVGNIFNSYNSPDGTTWTKIGSVTITMASNAFIGLCVTAHNSAFLSTVTFDNVTVSVGANSNPVAIITATPTSGTTPLTVSFSSIGSLDPDGEPISFAWNFGDGTTGAGATISHTYTTGGTFTAVLTVTDAHGSGTASVSITVPNPNPVAIIAANPTSGNAPLAVSFNSAGSLDPDGEPISFSWNFGDGTTGTGATISHTYASSGAFTAILTVSDAHGSDTASVKIVVGNPNPIAVITANPTSGNVPLAVSFSSAGSFDPDGESISFSWDFGDGTTGTGATLSHTYALAGTFTAVLTAIDAHGSGTASVIVTVSSASTLPAPWVNTDIGNVGIAGNATCSAGTFTVQGSGLDIWGQADAFQFVYQPLSGDGSIVARVVSQINNNGWAKAGVMIRESLNSGSVNAATLVTPLNGIQFQNRVATGGYSGHTAGPLFAAPYWVKIVRSGNLFKSYSSPDGNVWTKIDSVTFSMANNAYIGLCVTAHNSAVLSTVTFDNVVVSTGANPNPIAVISATPTSGNVPLTVSFSSAGSLDPDGEPISFSWDFGDGTTGTGATISHTYASTGTFTAVLTVTDAHGSGTASVNITVTNPNPIAVITANPTSGNAPLAVSFSSAGSSDPDGEPISFSWNFGDGTTGTGATISHTYASAGTFTAVLTVTDAHGSGTASVNITTSSSTTLPAPWANADIGSVGVAGSATYNAGAFTVKGSGVDIWGVIDGFQYVYQPLSGDGSIVARVVSQINNNGWAKAGAMIRESLNPGSVNAATLVTPVNGIQFQNRVTINGYSGHTAGALASVPYWVKIERAGNIFNSYSSPDGSTWTKIGSVTITMAGNAFIGLCVTAHNSTFLSTVTFDNVTASAATNANSVAATALNSTINQNTVAGIDTTNLATRSVRGFLPSGESNSAVVIFPNPFIGMITISLGINNPYYRAKIIDIYGKIVMEWDIWPDETDIMKDLSSLSKGIYLLKLEGVKKMDLIRIEKQ